jgi:hypothetical protein
MLSPTSTGWIPVKRTGATPTIVTGRPLTLSDCPTTSGRASSIVRQK